MTKITVTREERLQLALYAAVVIALHVIGWGWIWLVVAPQYPFMLGFAGLAYSFGLRHAFDADHIAAIDNTTRKLMTPERRPYGVGFFFSLGHSTIVFAMTLALALATRMITAEMPYLKAVGGLIGTAVSGLFLYAIGLLNLLVMIDTVRVFRALRRGTATEIGAEHELMAGGLLTRWFARVFRIATRPWHMYFIGLLFGLGFDTATEIGLLTTTAVAASQALPLSAILALPVVFAAGMSLLDSADGVLMCGAYGWAFSNPIRKVFYNLTVTGLSVFVALFIGTVELVSIVSDRVFGLHDGIWGRVQSIDMQAMGYIVTAAFVVSWAVSIAIWKLGDFDKLTPGSDGLNP
jgi:nickel/cobalt transporter (NiCoT) family protein